MIISRLSVRPEFTWPLLTPPSGASPSQKSQKAAGPLSPPCASARSDPWPGRSRSSPRTRRPLLEWLLRSLAHTGGGALSFRREAFLAYIRGGRCNGSGRQQKSRPHCRRAPGRPRQPPRRYDAKEHPGAYGCLGEGRAEAPQGTVRRWEALKGERRSVLALQGRVPAVDMTNVRRGRRMFGFLGERSESVGYDISNYK